MAPGSYNTDRRRFEPYMVSRNHATRRHELAVQGKSPCQPYELLNQQDDARTASRIAINDTETVAQLDAVKCSPPGLKTSRQGILNTRARKLTNGASYNRSLSPIVRDSKIRRSTSAANDPFGHCLGSTLPPRDYGLRMTDEENDFLRDLLSDNKFPAPPEACDRKTPILQEADHASPTAKTIDPVLLSMSKTRNEGLRATRRSLSDDYDSTKSKTSTSFAAIKVPWD